MRGCQPLGVRASGQIMVMATTEYDGIYSQLAGTIFVVTRDFKKD